MISVANNKNDKIDLLIKLAILYYQFEAIHPFKDGSGRTGRVINVLLLSAYNLLGCPILYLSKYINEYKNDYYHFLIEVTEKEQWQNLILFLLKTIEETSKYTLQKR